MANNAYSETIRRAITAELKLDGFTDEEKDEIIEFLEENSIKQVHLDLISQLGEDDKDEFYRLSEKREPERIEAFLREKVPDFQKIVERAAKTTVQDFIKLQSL